MKTLKQIVKAQHAARDPHDDPLTDRLLAEIMSLGEEVCVLRDRLDTAERLAAAGVSVDADAIDAYAPPPDVVEERLAQHKDWFESVFSRLTAAGDKP